ncbi:MAG TPA: hypothetical protein VN255_00085 [Mycobacterium sp.]|nr:hypothetical protein [Mycobacterium sp.]HWT47034.1 hypothetical protein [Mycobacterium sp.]
MPARIVPAQQVRAVVALLAVSLAAIGSPAAANASNDAAGSSGVPNPSNDAVGSPGLPSPSNGGPGKPGVGNASDDDSDDTNPHPKSHRYADAVGSELTLPLAGPQALPSLFGTTVPEGTDGSAAGMPGAGGDGGMLAPSKPIVMPAGQTAAPQGGQSTSPAVPASPIVPVAPR